jgi:hypothetical protein
MSVLIWEDIIMTNQFQKRDLQFDEALDGLERACEQRETFCKYV